MVRVFSGISLAAFLSIAGFGRSVETPLSLISRTCT